MPASCGTDGISHITSAGLTHSGAESPQFHMTADKYPTSERTEERGTDTDSFFTLARSLSPHCI